jgi:hypothetical protein
MLVDVAGHLEEDEGSLHGLLGQHLVGQLQAHDAFLLEFFWVRALDLEYAGLCSSEDTEHCLDVVFIQQDLHIIFSLFHLEGLLEFVEFRLFFKAEAVSEAVDKILLFRLIHIYI